MLSSSETVTHEDSVANQLQNSLNPGSAIATLWILTSQDKQPPASIPSSVLPISTCPRCNHKLSSALKPSGLQTCAQCGWIG